MKWSEMTADERRNLMAEKVMGWHIGDNGHWYDDKNKFPIAMGYDNPCGEPYDSYAWTPEESIEDAWQVMEHMTNQLDYIMLEYDSDDHAWTCTMFDWEVDMPTAPAAICLAALQACGVDIEP